MRIIARSVDKSMPLSPAIREHILRRLHFSLAPVRARQPRVEVWVGDENGPRGGNDKYCSIRAEIDGQSAIFVHEQRSDLYRAVAAATARIGRTVLRAVQRRERGRFSRQRAVFEPLTD